MSIDFRVLCWRFASVTVLISSLSHAQSPGVVPGKSREWSVEGTVKKGEATVAGAVIRIDGAALVNGATSDSTGHFQLKGAVPGMYTISVEKEGTGGATPKSVLVAPGGDLRGLDFLLQEEVVLAGRVVDSSRHPVKGATVMAWVKSSRNGVPSFLTKGFAETDDTGSFRIDELGEGRYLLVAVLAPVRPKPHGSRAGNQQTQPASQGIPRYGFFPTSSLWESASLIDVRYGDQREGLDLVLGQTSVYCASMAVRTPPGPNGTAQTATVNLFAPVAGTFLQLGRGPVKTDDELEFCGLPAGEYKAATVTFDAQTKKATGYGKVDFRIGKRDVELGPMTAAPAVRMGGSIRIAGAAAGESVPLGLVVTLELRNRPIYYGENRTARVDQVGRFSIEGAFPDDFGLSVSGLPQGYYLREATQDGRDVLRSFVRPGAGDLTLTLGKNGPVLNGRTLDRANQVAAGAAIGLIALESGTVYIARSDALGRFQFHNGLAPGKYTLVALGGLLAGEAEDPDTYRQQASKGVSLELGANARKDQDFAVAVVR